jgi:hypothetical protein
MFNAVGVKKRLVCRFATSFTPFPLAAMEAGSDIRGLQAASDRSPQETQMMKAESWSGWIPFHADAGLELENA